MKLFFGILMILGLSFKTNAQTKLSTKDSINIFFDSLFSVLKTDYLYKDKVNWTAIESEIKVKFNQYEDFKQALSQTTSLFDKINATHCQLFYMDTIFTATYIGPSENDFSEQWIKKYSTNPSFEVKLLDQKYAYILLPGMNYKDISAENIHKIAQPMYDQIVDLKSKHKLEGWVIDLRFNTGGNPYHMLLSLYDILGDNILWGELDKDKNMKTKVQLKDGKYLQNNEVISYILPKGERFDKSKVAIITGIITASSGEITAISFKGRENTIFIGETTNGLTTTNDKRDLPFGVFMALTTGYDCDRNKIFYNKIIPDIKTTKQDNFDNLLLDKNIQEAIHWMKKK